MDILFVGLFAVATVAILLLSRERGYTAMLERELDALEAELEEAQIVDRGALEGAFKRGKTVGRKAAMKALSKKLGEAERERDEAVALNEQFAASATFLRMAVEMNLAPGRAKAIVGASFKYGMFPVPRAYVVADIDVVGEEIADAIDRAAAEAAREEALSWQPDEPWQSDPIG